MGSFISNDEAMKVMYQISKDIILNSNEKEKKLYSKFTYIQHDRNLKNIDEIQRFIDPCSKILDIGCGFGQISAYLSSLGHEVIGADVQNYQCWNFLMRKYGCKLLHIKEDCLPFDDEFFDAIVCFGVLEHVGEYDLSTKKEKESNFLHEMHRILKSHGFFFIYSLPNKYSYIEFIAKKLGLYFHKKTYSKKEAVNIIVTAGFEIIKIYKSGVIPAIDIFKPLHPIINMMSFHYKIVNKLDFLLSKVCFCAENFNIVSWKRE